MDIVIAEYFEIKDKEKAISRASFIKKILWAVESESDTSITAMADDFGKLAVVKADNYVYLNGLNQDSHYSARGFMEGTILP